MAMVVITCKYKCTIKGSELDVVLELHGQLDMLSPDKLSRLLLSMKPVQLNNLSASVLVAKTQRYFLASLHRLGNCGLLGLNQSKGSSPSSRAFSERSCLLLLC